MQRAMARQIGLLGVQLLALCGAPCRGEAMMGNEQVRSSLNMAVIAVLGDGKQVDVGTTEGGKKVAIPVCRTWALSPRWDVKDPDFVSIVAELIRLHAPGLILEDAERITDKGLAGLEQVPHLMYLKLLNCSSITDEGIAHVAKLQSLTDLSLLGCTKITNAGIGRLAQCKQLKSLCLPNHIGDRGVLQLAGMQLDSLVCPDEVTDKGLEAIAGLPSLKSLSLPGSVTDAGLLHVAKAQDLEELYCTNCRGISDAGIGQITGLKRLRKLSLARTGIANAGLAAVARIGSLETLILTGSRITDAGLPALSELRQLSSLDLADTSITDAGLGALEKLTGLKRLVLLKTRISETGVLGLRRSLPACDIRFGAAAAEETTGRERKR